MGFDRLRRWGDRVAEVDVDVESDLGGGQGGGEGNPNSRIGIGVANRFCGGCVGVEQEAVVRSMRAISAMRAEI